jgi:hypothetical protein
MASDYFALASGKIEQPRGAGSKANIDFYCCDKCASLTQNFSEKKQ